jgi:hypothetical protein
MANGEDGNITFRVTPSFHYGQKGMMGKNHFLVFHPSDRTIIFQVIHPSNEDCMQIFTGH